MSVTSSSPILAAKQQQQQLPSDFVMRMLTAVDRGDISKIKELLSSKKDLMFIKKNEDEYLNFFSQLQDDFAQQTIFHIACSSGREEVLKLFLSSSSSTTTKQEKSEQESASSSASSSFCIPQDFYNTRLTLLTKQDQDGWCPLHCCVVASSLECLKVLVSCLDSKIIQAMMKVKGLGGTAIELAEQQQQEQQQDSSNPILALKNKEILAILKNHLHHHDDNDEKQNKNNNTTSHQNDEDEENNNTVMNLKMMIEAQKVQLMQQQMQLQQCAMMIQQLQTENRDLHILLKKEKDEHEKTKKQEGNI